MINIVLMAGSGKRFTDAGYKVSKPLISVSGRPMVLQAVSSMPPSERWVIVVRKEHLDEDAIIETLRKAGSHVEILVDSHPIGQLNSCLVAKEFYLHEAPVFIGACDFGMEYDKKKYSELVEGENPPDIIVFSFTQQPNLSRNPYAWGWLKQDNNLNITGVSVKIPISDTPYNDYAIVGSFTFKSGEIFTRIADELISRGLIVEGEYYIDSMIDVAVEMGYQVKSFPVKYIGWGAPADYEEYLYWEKVIAQPLSFPNAESIVEYDFWHTYFNNILH